MTLYNKLYDLYGSVQETVGLVCFCIINCTTGMALYIKLYD